MVFGRWHKQNSDWKFVVDTEDNQKADFSVGQKVELIDGYWGERVELIIDKSIKWKKVNYSATDRIDHDHCLICRATISEIENKQYMLANERVAGCLNCFKTYAKQGRTTVLVCLFLRIYILTINLRGLNFYVSAQSISWLN